MELKKTIDSYVRAGFPILNVNTAEESRGLATIKEVAKERGRRAFVFSITRGIVDLDENNTDSAERQRLAQIKDPLEFVKFIRQHAPLEPSNSSESGYAGGGLFVYLDPNDALEKDQLLLRGIKDEIVEFRKGKTLIFMSTFLKPPMSLEPYITDIDVPLPSRKELAQAVIEASGENVPDEILDPVVTALMGLTTDQAGDAVGKSIVDRGELDPLFIMQEKCAQLSKLDFLQVIPRDQLPTPDQVGGLENLIDYLLARRNQFSKKARDFGLPIPRGILLIGPPGTGKSLTAKASGGALMVPIIKFRTSAIMDMYHGGSERNMRLAQKVAEAMAPCGLWLDELDKTFTSNNKETHEATSRVLGELLTWMEEKTAPVFMLATANNVKGLSESYPELFRKGRFDEIFFVDLPDRKGREAIWAIQIEKMGRSPEVADVSELARITENWSGAEIEGAVRSAMVLAFDDDGDLEQKYLLQAIKETVPGYEFSRETITSLREWASARARPANRVGEQKKSSRRSIQK